MTRGLTLLVVTVAATVAGLVCAEVGGQAFFRAKSGHWLWEDTAFMKNTQAPYVMATGDAREYALRPGYRDDTVTVDAQGFRTTEPMPEPSDRVIVNLGDSVVFGTSVKDDETYSAQLAARLKGEKRSLGVVNAGITSYTTKQTFDRLHLDVEPRYGSRIAALTYHSANDISLVFNYNTNYSPDLTWARERHLIPLRPEYQRFALGYYLVKADTARAQLSLPAPTRTPEQSAEDQMIAAVRDMLRREIAAANDRKIEVFLCPVNPFYYQFAHQEKNEHLRVLREFYNGAVWEMKGWDPLVRRFDDMLKSAASEFPNAHYVETRDAFDADNRDAMYVDYLHLTEVGHRRMAEILYDALVRAHVIDAAAPTS